MTCKCKKHKRGSGNTYLSGVTWHKGSGMRMDGGGIYKKKRRKKKKKGGMTMTGGGISFSGAGMPFTGSGVSAALRWVVNKKRNGRRVA